MSTYHYRLFSSLLKLSPIFNFLPKNQKKISLIVEHTMEWRRQKRWETIYSRKETSSAQLHRNQPVLYHLSVFQKSLQDTTKYRGISSFICQNFGIHGISWGATLPHSEAWNTMSSKLLALRLKPINRDIILTNSSLLAWFMYLILLQI